MTAHTFDSRLKEQALLGLEVTDRILRGEDVSNLQGRTAISIVGAELKNQSNENGRVSRIISLAKLGVTDAAVRQTIAEAALKVLLPNVQLSRLAGGPPPPKALKGKAKGKVAEAGAS